MTRHEEIYSRFANGETDTKKLAKEYNITPERVLQIIKKKEHEEHPLREAVSEIKDFRGYLEAASGSIVGNVDDDIMAYYNNLVRGFDLFIDMLREADEKKDEDNPREITERICEGTGIKPVKDIPGLPAKKISQRDLIRRDINHAYQNGIAKFEFVSENYKYETLQSSAKEALRRWFCDEVYFPAARKARVRLEEVITGRFWTKDESEYSKKAYGITTRRLEDRLHIYCFLNLEMFKSMEQIIYDDTLRWYKERWPEQVKDR